MDKDHFDSIYKHYSQAERQCHMVEDHTESFTLGAFDIHWAKDE